MMKKTVLTAFAFCICMAPFAQSPINLKFNLEKGKVYHMKSTSKQDVKNNYNGMQFATVVNTNTFISYSLLSQAKEVMNIEISFDTIQSKTTSPMMNKETNSAIPAKSKEYLERMLNKFSSEKIVAKISTSGKFLGFENYKSFHDKIMLVMDSVPEGKKDQIQKQADMFMKESAIRSMIEPLFAYLPENPVKQGDKWENSVTQSGGGISAMLFNTFSLDGVESNNILLSGNSEMESIPSNDPNAMMSADIKGTSSAKLTIDKSTGLILNGTTKSHAEGTLKINNQGNEMKMPMVIDSQSETVKIN